MRVIAYQKGRSWPDVEHVTARFEKFLPERWSGYIRDLIDEDREKVDIPWDFMVGYFDSHGDLCRAGTDTTTLVLKLEEEGCRIYARH